MSRRLRSARAGCPQRQDGALRVRWMRWMSGFSCCPECEQAAAASESAHDAGFGRSGFAAGSAARTERAEVCGGDLSADVPAGALRRGLAATVEGCARLGADCRLRRLFACGALRPLSTACAVAGAKPASLRLGHVGKADEDTAVGQSEKAVAGKRLSLERAADFPAADGSAAGL